MIKININMDFENGVATIDHMINNLPRELQTQERKCLNKIGAVIKKNVKKHLSKSNIEARLDEEPKNYDGSRLQHCSSVALIKSFKALVYLCEPSDTWTGPSVP